MKKRFPEPILKILYACNCGNPAANGPSEFAVIQPLQLHSSAAVFARVSAISPKNYFSNRFLQILFPVCLLLLIGAVSFIPLQAQAQTTQTSQQRCDNFKKQFTVGGVNPFDWVSKDYCTASGLLLKLINMALALAGTVAIVFIIFGGYQYLISAGNEELSEKGKKTLTNAVLGFVIIIMSFVIIQIITNTLTGKLGAPASTGNSAGNTNGGKTGGASSGQNQQALINGNSPAVLGKQYYFTVSSGKTALDGLCKSSGYTVFVTPYFQYPGSPLSNLPSSFTDNGDGTFMANFNVDPNTLGFTDANAANSAMVLEGFVCGQSIGRKTVTLQASGARGGN